MKGISYIGGACKRDKKMKRILSIAIVNDDGNSVGTVTAAHEIGHLLGAVHDGHPPEKHRVGPGASKCPDRSHIMAEIMSSHRNFKWSSCSLEQFRYFLNTHKASCLYNRPVNELLQLNEHLNLSLDEQCERGFGTSACYRDSRVCSQLYCFTDNTNQMCKAYRPAAEGSYCGHEKVCNHGKCVQNPAPTLSIDDIIGSLMQLSKSPLWNTVRNIKPVASRTSHY